MGGARRQGAMPGDGGNSDGMPVGVRVGIPHYFTFNFKKTGDSIKGTVKIERGNGMDDLCVPLEDIEIKGKKLLSQ